MNKTSLAANHLVADSLEYNNLRVREDNLLVAILERAIRDFYSIEIEARRSAIHWFIDPSYEYVFSFRRICERLNLNPKIMLEKLEAHELKQTNRMLCHYQGKSHSYRAGYKTVPTTRRSNRPMNPRWFEY